MTGNQIRKKRLQLGYTTDKLAETNGGIGGRKCQKLITKNMDH